MQYPDDEMQCVQVGISVFPTKIPPPPPPPPGIPPKLLAIMKKYKFNWRLDQLSKPKPPVTPKFIPIIVKPRYDKKKEIILTEEIEFYADHMSRPLLRTLVLNKRQFGKLKGKVFRKKITKRIAKSWASIYNFYKKKERDRRRRKLRMEQQKDGGKKKKKKEFKRTESLATPKQIVVPKPKKKKPKKIFSNFRHLDVLASPKAHHEEKPKREGINPYALTCRASEHTIRLAQLPERWLHLPVPLQPGKVKKSALKYKISPRVEALAVPRPRSEKANTDEDSGPWTISKSALTYKATPRIIELAKPIERD